MNKESKIVICISSVKIGGAETQALNLAIGFKQKGFENLFFLILSNEISGPMTANLDKLKIPFYIFNYSTYNVDYFKKLPTSFSEWKLFFRVKKMFKKFKECVRSINPFVIIPFTYYPNVMVGNSVSATSSKLFIWNQRDLGVDGFNQNFFEKKAISNAKVFITNSQQGESFLESKGIKDNKIIIKNSITPKTIVYNKNQWREKLGISKSDFFILKVSNIHQNKDHLSALLAFIELIKVEKYNNCTLVFAGRIDSKIVEPLTKIIQENNIEGKVRFVGFVEDTVGLIAAADLFLFSSYSEGSPNVILEAMAVGIPILSADLPCIRELLGNDFPYLFTPGDFMECKNLLIDLISKDNSNLIVHMKEKVELYHNIENVASSYLNVINNFTSK